MIDGAGKNQGFIRVWENEYGSRKELSLNSQSPVQVLIFGNNFCCITARLSHYK